MKARIRTTILLTALVGSLALAAGGCSKKTVIPPESMGAAGSTDGKMINYPPSTDNGYSESDQPVEGTLDDTARNTNAAAAEAMNESDAYKRQHGRSSQGLSPIYFDFDQSTVRADMTDRMVGNAKFLKEQPSSHVIVEGNTDERGTNEYNLALGERRAQNTKQYLINLGVDPVRIRTISYGEEKPLFKGQDEESYSMNRRVDFVIE